MGVLLVAAQRRVRRHRPAMREIAVGVGPADIVDAADFLRHRLGAEVERAHRIDEAERPTLLACAIVGHHDDERVVAHASRFEKANQPRQMPVGMIEHAGKGRLQAGEDAFLVGAVLVPRLHAVIARRHPGVCGHQPHRLLPRQPLLALDVPTMRKRRVVAHDDVRWRLMRRVAGAERNPGQPRQIGPVGDVIADEADRLVDEIGGQMIAVGIGPRRIDVRVAGDELRRILIGLGVEEAVEAIEAAAERPAVEGAGGAALGQRRHMPLPDHVITIGVRAQHLGDGAGLARDLAAIAGIAGIEIGEAADADRMMVAAGQQRRARGRAHRRGMEARIAQALGRQPIDGGRFDRRAVAAEIGEADIVEEDDENVGGAARRPGRVGPPRLRFLHGLADRAAKRLVACAHALPPVFRWRLIRRSLFHIISCRMG